MLAQIYADTYAPTGARRCGQPTQPLTAAQRPRRSNAAIQAEVQDVIWRESGLRSLEHDSIAVQVHDGIVYLTGHVANELQMRRIIDAVRSVPDVVGIENGIVTDTELVTAVAQALAADPNTCPHSIYVGAHHGWVRLGGRVPSAEVQAATEAVAARVPWARGVLTLPRIAGDGQAGPRRRPLQPLPGMFVYAADGAAGTVAEVVINPRNRLVSHIVVAARYELEGQLVRGQFVVPAEAIDDVTAAGVLLKDTAQTLAARPAFQPEAFPIAPESWQPPFPYQPGAVRWPREAREAATVETEAVADWPSAWSRRLNPAHTTLTGGGDQAWPLTA